jgi:hypothetical protein
MNKGHEWQKYIQECINERECARHLSLNCVTFFHALPTEKQIDLDTVDLRKLKVKELKKILNQWGEECRGCAEKSDFVNRINDLKPLHVEL